ncbi:cell division protein ZapA [Palleronia aestuarii]|uniref:Cell division protein ZapA n=1 Tax=Palleronia aestuarii TaxID=568105 RepID=A0A2W7NBN4_9RHOB|nr:cell division protein ZapA [Palleronia aestuarii]PZX17761.1 cell division protein ZapA [Palleronia aestuarii]
MPDETITIGGRNFEVSCEPGQEPALHSAAQLLDAEAAKIPAQNGRLSEPRMLLMAALMLADRTANLEAEVADRGERLKSLEREFARIRRTSSAAPERVEVPTIPAPLLETLAELAARSEALADAVEEKAEG